MQRAALVIVILALGGAGPVHPSGRTFSLAMDAPSIHDDARRVHVHLPASYDLPNARTRRYPVVFLLHGFPGRSGDWFGRGRADRTADSLAAHGDIPEVILVCPDGNRGFFGRTLYADSYDGSFPMERFMTHDLVRWTDSTFRTIPDAAHRAVIGLSDGGTGALNLLFRHPDLFGAAGSHSGAFRMRRNFGMAHVVGPADSAGPRLDALSPLIYLREPGAPKSSGIIYFDCGTDDEAIESNRELDALLDSLHVSHTFHELPGTHTWRYWRTHVATSLVAVMRSMERR